MENTNQLEIKEEDFIEIKTESRDREGIVYGRSLKLNPFYVIDKEGNECFDEIYLSKTMSNKTWGGVRA